MLFLRRDSSFPEAVLDGFLSFGSGVLDEVLHDAHGLDGIRPGPPRNDVVVDEDRPDGAMAAAANVRSHAAGLDARPYPSRHSRGRAPLLCFRLLAIGRSIRLLRVPGFWLQVFDAHPGPVVIDGSIGTLFDAYLFHVVKPGPVRAAHGGSIGQESM